MKPFRIQEHTPDVYPRKSRDFQLLCNAFDCVNNGVKYDIDSITNILDTSMCNEKLLPLLQTKLGFFTAENFNAEELRTILSAFYRVVKDKGSRKGILEAVEVFLKASNIADRSRVTTQNIDPSTNQEDSNNRLAGSYIIEVAIESALLDMRLLTEILKYVLPAGYKLRYSFYRSNEAWTEFFAQDVVNIVVIQKEVNDAITSFDREDKLINGTAVSTSSVMRDGDIETLEENEVTE